MTATPATSAATTLNYRGRLADDLPTRLHWLLLFTLVWGVTHCVSQLNWHWSTGSLWSWRIPPEPFSYGTFWGAWWTVEPKVEFACSVLFFVGATVALVRARVGPPLLKIAAWTYLAFETYDQIHLILTDALRHWVESAKPVSEYGTSHGASGFIGPDTLPLLDMMLLPICLLALLKSVHSRALSTLHRLAVFVAGVAFFQGVWELMYKLWDFQGTVAFYDRMFEWIPRISFSLESLTTASHFIRHGLPLFAGMFLAIGAAIALVTRFRNRRILVIAALVAMVPQFAETAWDISCVILTYFGRDIGRFGNQRNLPATINGLISFTGEFLARNLPYIIIVILFYRPRKPKPALTSSILSPPPLAPPPPA